MASDRATIMVAPSNRAGECKELRGLEEVDQGFATRVVTTASPEHGRLVLSPCGELRGETDDVRRVGDAAAAGARAAFAMGASRLSLTLDPAVPASQHPADGPAFAQAELVAALAVHQAAYVPLQAREARPPKKRRLSELVPDQPLAEAVEVGRALARDLASGDPERMAPPRLAEHVGEVCRAAGVGVEVVDSEAELRSEYPLLMAVARASLRVDRHRPRVVRLAWQGEGRVERTVCLAGKGVTYDTGGADLKVGGSMAGMRLDKGGAAAAAGFVLACARAPTDCTRGLRVLVELGCVRNSTGADAYVADEIITGHSGKRVLVGNTDMEGRMVLADCLSHLRERVLAEPAAFPRPVLLSLATLTGHAVRSFGPYAVALDGAAARAAGGVAPRLATAGALLGEPVEVGRVRREDFAHVAPGTAGTPVSKCPDAYDVLQTNTASSVNTPRGHQFPVAFLTIASGLQEHGAGSERPLPYCHIDCAGSVLDGHGVETGSPLLPLFGHFALGLGVQ